MAPANTTFGKKLKDSFVPFTLLLVALVLYCYSATGQTTHGILKLKDGQHKIKYQLDDDSLQSVLRLSAHGQYVYDVLVFENKLTEQQRQFLKAQQIELLGYLPDFAYEVRMPRNIIAAVLKQAGVKAMVKLDGEQKKGATLRQIEKTAAKQQGLLLSLQLQPDIQWNAVSSALSVFGVSLVRTDYLNQGLAQVMIPAGNVTAVASLPYVRYVDAGNWEIHPLNQRERGLFGLTNLSNNTTNGRNLKGAGISVGIGDDSDPTLHLDLRDNVINRSPSWTGFNHGRLVAGITGGDGIVEERYTGAAPSSLLISDYFNLVIAKANTYVSDYNMSVTNNSYFQGLANCPGNSDYNELSVFADQQLFNNPYLQHIFAAGNDGGLTCSPYPASFATIKSGFQTAKNILDVGNMTYFTADLHSSSSRGPVEDGRIKPEIVASGRNVVGPINSSDYLAAFVGTSFAAPFVTGVWALLTERYKQLNSNNLPKSGLLKAVVCNSADDRGNAGPDFSWGFGLINPRKAIECIESNRYFSGTISTGVNQSQVVAVPAGTTQVKVMLYWHDKEGSPLSSKALVNDLDLTVIDGVTTYQPWVLNPSPASVTAAATRGIDRLNNIEQVTINSPGSSISININGFDVPQGPQEYFVVYEFLGNGIVLEYPFGGEKFSPGQEEFIRWSAYDNGSNSFTLEVSYDDGSTWNVVNNNIGSSSFYLGWSVPAIPTNKGKMRITRNGGGPSFTTPGNFTILAQPTLTAVSPCEGYVDLSWNASAGATDYEILQLVNNQFVSVGTTSLQSYRVAGLDRNTDYWFTVRARMNDSTGMRATARMIRPFSTLPCTNAAFDNDLKADTLLAPANGRQFTGTALSSNQTISLVIRNLDNNATSGSYDLKYQVNGGSWVTENSNAVIAAGGTATYHFSTLFDFSIPGTYVIRTVVKYPGDTQTVNDTLTTTIVHAPNPALTLPFTETFENTGTQVYTSNTFAINGANRFDFNTANSNGRLRTFINSGVAINGNRSATLDANFFNYTVADNKLTGTFNLSNYTGQSGMRISFKFKNHGQLKMPGTGVWLRGSDASSWIAAYNLSSNQGIPGATQTVSINLDDLGLLLTSSFQMRFDQAGLTSANNGTYNVDNPDLDDGFSFDDINIVQANNDVWVKQVTAPSEQNCSPGSTAVTIRVKNTSTSLMNNIPVFYRINNGSPVAGNISSLAAGAETDYTFPVNADISVIRAYIIDVWSAFSGDDYPLNDSVRNYMVYATPQIRSFPYFERFDESNGGWYTDTLSYSSWRWGTPAKSVMNRAASGNKGWFNTLNSTYKTNEDSYLYSPCFNLSGLTQPVFSFAHISQQEDNCNCDYHTLEYSIDNGSTWQRLTTVNGTNWFDSSNNAWRRNIQRWHVSSAEVPNAANIRFRFYLSSDEFTVREGIGIDDIHIFEKSTIYTGANVLNLSESVSGNNWVNFHSGGNLIASIHPQGQDIGQIDVSVYFNTGKIRSDGTLYYLNRNIVIKPSTIMASPIKLRIYFTDTEANDLIAASGCSACTTLVDAFLVGITGFKGASSQENGSLTDNTGGFYSFITPEKVDVAPYNNGYYAELQINSFSEYWINSGGSGQNDLAPFRLTQFKGIRRDIDGALSWQTSGEQNSDFYEVERRMDYQTAFTSIGRVIAAGNSTESRNYNFTDPGIMQRTDTAFYRLKMYDKSGNFSYSNVIFITDDRYTLFIRNIGQTISGDVINIQTGNIRDINRVNIRILNAAGQLVYLQQYPYQDIRIQLNHLSPGIYLMEISDEKQNHRSIQKLSRQ